MTDIQKAAIEAMLTDTLTGPVNDLEIDTIVELPDSGNVFVDFTNGTFAGFDPEGNEPESFQDYHDIKSGKFFE